MCTVANGLRLRWYDTVERLVPDTNGPTESQLWLMALERTMPEYQRALYALKNHLSSCDTCAQEKQQRYGGGND